MTKYASEILDPEEDNGTMVESLKSLTDAIIGHRIVKVEEGVEIPDPYCGTISGTVITLDSGKRVSLAPGGDCCAFTELESFKLNPELIQHAITGVGTTDKYQTWHIFADAGDVMEMKVGWSCGNPFYYGYGFVITVQELV